MHLIIGVYNTNIAPVSLVFLCPVVDLIYVGFSVSGSTAAVHTGNMPLKTDIN